MATIYVSPTGNDTTGNGSSDAPYASPGKAVGVANDGDTVSVAAGVYLVTSATKNVAGGKISLPSGVSMVGTGATRPILRASGISNLALLSVINGSERQSIQFIEADGQNLSDIVGFEPEGGGSNSVRVHDCVFRNCAGGGFRGNDTEHLSASYCLATNCGGAGAFRPTRGQLFGCVALNNPTSGFYGRGNYSRCLALANTGSSGHGFNFENEGGATFGCTAWGNAGSGFRNYGGGIRGQGISNSIAYANARYGIEGESGNVHALLGLAFGANTLGNTAATLLGVVNTLALTADPFVNSGASIGNVADAFAAFAPNTAAGGGALVRGTGYPSGSDYGAVQHSDGSGGAPTGAPRSVAGLVVEDSMRINDSFDFPFSLLSASGALVNADATPTGVVRRNGNVVSGASITFSNSATGEYRATVVFAASDGWAVGDRWTFRVNYAIGGVNQSRPWSGLIRETPVATRTVVL